MPTRRLALLLLAAAPTAALAHHSIAANYDTARRTAVSGRLTLVEIENPHSRFELEADGLVWKVESRGVSGMAQRGFDRELFKVGTMVKVEGSPARDGSRALWLNRLTDPSGKMFDASR